MNSVWLSIWGWVYEKALAALTQPAGGVGIVEALGSGYSVEGDRMANIEKLRALGEEAIASPSFAPLGGKTYCNFATRFIVEGMGFFGLPRAALMNEMISFLSTAPGWREDSIDRGWECAMKGGVAIVCLEESPHGHGAVIAPEPRQLSGSLGIEVPLVFNVGKTNGLMRLSQAFRPGDFYRLRTFVWEESVA